VAAIVMCNSNWDCGEWSRCIKGVQVRYCEDMNDCRFEKNKPDESISCTMPRVEQPAQITAKTALPTSYIITGFVIVVICIAALVLLLKEEKPKKRKKK
jgi:hypothetical protein